MTTLADAFDDGESTALIVPESPALNFTYKQLKEHVLSLQEKLRQLGITEKSPVSIAIPNSFAFTVAFLATSWQRGIAAPLNPAYKQEEFEFYISDLDSALALVPQGAYEKKDPAVLAAKKYNAAVAECYWHNGEVVFDVKDRGKLEAADHAPTSTKPQPEDVALVLHTSGTTGRPKAVPLTHQNLLASMETIVATYKLSENDRTMLVMPLFHVHGLLAGFLSPLFSGGSLIVPPALTGSFWKDFSAHEANWFTATPTMHQILLKYPLPDPKPTIRFVRSCSSPLSPTLLKRMADTFGTCILEAYAMTEAAHQMTSNPLPEHGESVPGSVGIPHGDIEIKIVNESGSEVEAGAEGEICVRGSNVTKGYLNNPEANKSSFDSDGFFRTGDQGKRDSNGYLVLTGRIKELINKGGEKISPVELDNVFSQHEAVSEAVSFAVQDELYGEDVGVALVLKDGSQLKEAEFKKWVMGKLSAHKTPKKIIFTDEIPKTATGKVQRRTVAEVSLKSQ